MVSDRPPVSVIVAFAGREDELRALLVRLARIELGDDDEVIVADNRARAGQGWSAGPIRVLPAAGVRAPGFARNRAAAVARGDWLVFLDADTSPSPTLLERYFEPAPASAVGVLGGGIVDRPGGDSPVARRSAERAQMSHRTTLHRAGRPYAQTANCAVRRNAFEAVAGFDEWARSGEDADLCFRLAEIGWRLEERPAAVVEHPTRPTLRALLAQLARHGAGAGWLHRRYPDQFAGPGARALGARLGRAAGDVAAAGVRGDAGGAQAALIELAGACAFELGRWLPNRPRRS
jgi:cellulose synthase/poly-beta-1,6-N-acetylglucosamine synthase-like glycosyltransferase